VRSVWPLKSKVTLFDFRTFVACLGLTTAGCFFEGTVGVTDDEPPPVVIDDDPPPPPADDISTVFVDSNASMETDPGYGVGLYVQYAEGGYWTVYTSCDTALGGESCTFDVVLSPEDGLDLYDVSTQDFDAADMVEFYEDGSLHMVVDTTYGLNGVAFRTEPGASIQVDTLLDGYDMTDLVYSVSRGVVREGVDTNPVEFVPDLP
jgi:hypothetical protein